MLDIVAVCSGKISVKSNDGSINDIFKILQVFYSGFEGISMDGL